METILVKWWFLLSAFPAIEGSLRLGKPEDFSAEERVMKKIQETCYGATDFEDLIFILGDFNEVFDKASVIRMNDLPNVDGEYESRQLLSIGPTKVLIIENSPKRLHSDLISFKKTRWWNNMLPFSIIGKNDEKCGNFNEILITTWKMEILNSVYICSESENTTLYTLNPITNYAPDPWKRMEDLNNSNIYHQIFDPRTSCTNLNYDKTKVLNGYQIRTTLSFPPSDAMSEIDFPNIQPILPFRKFLREQLNVRIHLKPVLVDNQSHHFREREADVILWKFTSAKDIRGSPLYFLTSTPCVAIVESNARTVLHMLRHLWSTQVLCVSAISLIILYFILRMMNDEITSAILDVIRFFICVSIRTDTRSNSFRIYFATMLIFIVITNGIFQGEIAAFLTKSDKVSPIKTVKELNDLGYHFYIVPRCYRMLSELHLSESNVELIDEHRIDHYVLNGTLNAWIIPSRRYLQRYSSQLLSHITPQVEILHPYSWTSRRDWPIYERFNSMLMQIFECSIPLSFHDTVIIRTTQSRDKVNDHELAPAEIQSSYRPIELADLNLAFQLLAIGLCFAMFVLIVELRMREI